MNQNLNSNLHIRPRRNRKTPWIRNLLAETQLQTSNLIMPFFVIEGENQKQAITTLPGQYRFSIDLLLTQVKKVKNLGIPAIMLFPAISNNLKSPEGKEAQNPNNLICQAVRAIKTEVPEIGVICDVALDPYTTSGHDGLLGFDPNYVLNDQTVEALCQQALVQAQAGCDVVAPSDMMDGRVLAIRKYLDQNGFENVNIMSYAAKYASNFYGAFRMAVGSQGNLSNQSSINKQNYQMDFRNSLEAIREINLDIAEGADMLIIKPAMSYLDVMLLAKQNCYLPIIGYQVSSEYAMLKLGAENNLFDFNSALLETIFAIKRAGATAIISYGAIEIAEFLLYHFQS